VEQPLYLPALKGNKIKAPPISGRQFEVQSSQCDDVEANVIRSESNTVIRGGIPRRAFEMMRRRFVRSFVRFVP
jgi:hypothetical protein